jgi:integrase
VKTGFGDRFPETVTQRELLDYLKGLKGCEARTVRNHKNALSAFFGWVRDQQLVANNPAAGIRKRMLPKEQKKEIGFLSLEQAAAYLRAAERYAPEMVAHEVVQLISGVRADDEMGDFRAEFVLPQTRKL